MDEKMTTTQLEICILNELAEIMEIDIKLLDKYSNFERLGIDSLAIAQLSGKLSDILNTSVNAEIFYDFNTVEKVAAYLLEND